MRRYSAPIIEGHESRDGVAQTLLSRPKVL